MNERLGSLMPMRLMTLCLTTLFLAACSVQYKPADDVVAKMRTVWNEAMIEREPLCIEAGPFPFVAGRGACDRCQELAAAGLLVRGTSPDGRVSYALSAEGRAAYRLEPDPEFLALIEARYAKNRPGEKMPPPSTWNRPRMCFGRTRFHSIADALAPMSLGSDAYYSIKLVAEAEDTSGLLFDPRIAALGLPLPPRPEPGQSALYAPQVVTFQYVRMSGEWWIDDSFRYGPWALED
jgi:hypothetical protein